MRSTSLESIETTKIGSHSNTKKEFGRGIKRRVTSATAEVHKKQRPTRNKNGGCPVCPGELHKIYRCSKFLAAKPKARYEIVRQHGLCINCLGTDHQSKDCRSGNCQRCQGKHNTRLHFDSPSSSTEAATKNETL